MFFQEQFGHGAGMPPAMSLEAGLSDAAAFPASPAKTARSARRINVFDVYFKLDHTASLSFI
jgi:hypothetical protein